MDITQLIRKAVENTDELSQDEKQFLINFQIPNNDSLINELQLQIEEAKNERDSAKGSLDDYIYQAGVEKLANSFNFVDKNYLNFLCKQNNIDCNNEASYVPFFNQLKESSPKLFSLDMKSGYNRAEISNQYRHVNCDNNSIESLLNYAPELK